MPDFVIRVIVDPSGVTRGSRQVTNKLSDVDRAAMQTQRLLKRVFATVGGVALVRSLVRTVDALTNLRNRLRIVTTDTENLNHITNQLYRISNSSRSSFEGTAEIYSRMAIATKHLGTSQKELLRFTEVMNKAIIISGASTIEARAAMIQLSQGMASTQLRGEELRSVMEQLPRVAQLIAKEMGVATGKLYALGKAGAITQEIVFSAVRNYGSEILREFETSIPTISQSINVLKNNFKEYISTADRVNGTSSSISKAILEIANDIDRFIGYLKVLGTVIASVIIVLVLKMAFTIGVSLVASLKAATLWTIRFYRAVLVLAAPLRVVGALIAVFGLALASEIAYLNEFTKEVNAANLSIDGFNRRLGKVSKEELGTRINIEKLNKEISILDDRINKASSTLDSRSMLSTGVYGDIFKGAIENIKKQKKELENQRDGLNIILKSLLVQQVLYTREQDAINNIRRESSNAKQFNAYLEILGRENQLLGLNIQEREILKNIFKAEKDLKRSLTETEKLYIATHTKLNLKLQRQAKILDDLNKGPTETYKQNIDDIIDLAIKGSITMDGFAESFNRFQREFEKAQRSTPEGVIAGLEREIELLGMSAQARTRLSQVEEQLNKTTGIFTAKQRAQVVELVKTKQGVEALAQVMDEIYGPAATLNLITEHATRAYREGRLELEQLTAVLAKARENYEATISARNTTTTFSDITKNLKQENELLRVNAQQRQVLQAIYSAENTLKRSLTDPQRKEIARLISTNQILQARADLMERLRGPQRQFIIGVQAATAELNAGKIDLQEYNVEVARLQNTLDQGGRDFASGVRRGLFTIRDNATNTAQQVEDVMTKAWRGATHELATFLTTGKANFADFASSIITEITRIYTELLILKALGLDQQNNNNNDGLLGTILSGLIGGASAGSAIDTPGSGIPTPKFRPSGGGGLPGFNRGGSLMVGGVPGVDKNLLSLNNQPVARVSRGETLDINPRQNRTIPPININLGNESGARRPTIVKVYNNVQDTQVREEKTTGPNGEEQIKVFFDRIQNGIAQNIAQGTGPIPKAFESRYQAEPKPS